MATSSAPTTAKPDRTIVLTNALIRTMTGPTDVAEAIAIRGERIIAVGSREDVKAIAGPGAEVQDLGGGMLIPGLIDAHMHLEVLERYDESLDGLTSAADVVRGLRAKAQSLSAGEWLIMPAEIEEAARPSSVALDEAFPSTPTVLLLGGGRYLLNKLALRHLDDELVAKEGAFVETDAAGAPAGLVATKGEDRLKYIVKDAPLYTAERVDKAVAHGMELLSRSGVTSAGHIVKDRWPIEAYKRRVAAGTMPVRMGVLTRIWQAEFGIDDIAALDLDTDPKSWLRFHGLKASIDGYFPFGGAWFKEPYSDNPEEFGFFRIPIDRLNEIVSEAQRRGMRMCLHANGDAAIETALEAYERAIEAHPRADHRHRIEHFGNQYCSDEQMARARRLGVVAMPNPTFLQDPAPHLAHRLGPVRSARPVPLRTLLDRGVSVGVGSDFLGLGPVEPLVSIAALVTRTTQKGDVFAPHEAISAWEALRLYTVHNAWVNFEEHVKGQITPGRLADFTHLSADLLSLPGEEIPGVTVLGTMVGGDWKFRAGR